ncbi:MALD2 protein, partial [Polyodon spathula]|nr:MALD2 protein [Polyodon spathula]
MSSGGSSSVRFDRIRGPRYDEVSVDPPVPVDSRRSLDELRGSDLARSADPLPPPALPIHPPVGPEFYHSENDESVEAIELKPVRRFIPDSVKNFFRGSRSEPQLDISYRDPYGASGSSYNSRLPMLPHDPYDSLDRRTHHTAMTYSERVEEYHMKYSYMKSWPGLLRILAVFELLLGAAVFACVCAYIHKDNEWFNMFGYRQPYDYGGSSAYGGYYYSGPKTPFVLVVAGLAWLVTVILLVLGMTMYYRTILLDSHWWPLTEFGLNIALFILYLAAAIVYVNDTNRGGLCSYPLFNNGINGAFCRVEGGQTAGMIFLFVTVLMYLISAIVCLKLWRHETARRYKQHREHEKVSLPHQCTRKVKMFIQQGAVVGDGRTGAPAVIRKEFRPVDMKPGVLSGHIPAGHIPNPVVVPDYVVECDSSRGWLASRCYMLKHAVCSPRYKLLVSKLNCIAVFKQHLINTVDPAFLEKKERCEYLKSKLSHIKQKIQEYDKVMGWNDGYST